MDKTEFRRLAKAKRNLIHAQQGRSATILSQLLALPQIQNAKKIASYVSFGSELDTKSVNQWILEEKELYLPRVTGENIIFHRIEDVNTQLVPGKFNILEPLSSLPVLDALDESDVILVPGLSFTPEGFRMGYGGGYYDRFLSTCSAVKIGICYEEQLVDWLPTEPWDVKLDRILVSFDIQSK